MVAVYGVHADWCGVAKLSPHRPAVLYIRHSCIPFDAPVLPLLSHRSLHKGMFAIGDSREMNKYMMPEGIF
jgi:hypothetical protein